MFQWAHQYCALNDNIYIVFGVHLICQGKDSSNYSAEDMGCILGTKSEKVTRISNLFLHFVQGKQLAVSKGKFELSWKGKSFSSSEFVAPRHLLLNSFKLSQILS